MDVEVQTSKSWVLKTLREVTRVPTLVAQGAGYFPFAIDPHHHQSFSFKGPHFINLVVQSIIGTVCPLFCIFSVELHSELADGWSATEKFAYGMMFNIISISKGVIRLSSVLRRQRIHNFYKKFNAAMEILLGGTDGGEEQTKEWLLGTKKKLRCIWLLIVSLESILLPLMIVLLLRIVSDDDRKTPTGHLRPTSLGRVSLFIGAMAICAMTGVLYSSFLYLLVSIINCFNVAFRVLGQSVTTCDMEKSTTASTINCQLDTLDSVTTTNALLDGEIDHLNVQLSQTDSKSKEEVLDAFIESYNLLEDVIKDFNETFKYHMSIILLGCCSSWILHTFVLLSSVMKEGFQLFGTALLLLWVMLDTAGIVVICTASCRLADQAKQAATAMKKCVIKNVGSENDSAYAIKGQIHLSSALSVPMYISPGNYFVLKRSTIISIYAVMTTYVFVVLQFQDAELQNRI